MPTLGKSSEVIRAFMNLLHERCFGIYKALFAEDAPNLLYDLIWLDDML